MRDDLLDDMLADIDPPPELTHRVIHDRLAQMTPRLERKPSLCTRRAHARARALGYGVRGVIYMRDWRTGVYRHRVVAAWWCWPEGEMEAQSGEALSGGLERDGW